MAKPTSSAPGKDTEDDVKSNSNQHDSTDTDEDGFSTTDRAAGTNNAAGLVLSVGRVLAVVAGAAAVVY